MIGTKRRNVSFSSNDDDIPFQSKRVGAESPAAGQAAASNQVETSSTPPLDRRRAVRQHVRALNTEFASWVQSQIQCHPDELWEDGIRDYLSHASEILEKFTDVVNWMKANNGNNPNGTSNFENQSSEKKNPSETSNNKEPKSFPEKIVFGSPSTYSNLATSPNTALNSGAFGAQNSVNGSPATSACWSFGLSASSQALSQSSSAGIVTSWGFGTSSNNNNNTLSPIKSDSFSAETPALTMSTGSMSSAGVGLFSQNQTPTFGSTPSFAAPWNGGVLSNSQTGFKFDSGDRQPLSNGNNLPVTHRGNNNSAASNDNAKENADEDDEPEQPSSPSLKSSEEKGIVVVHETKCKLYLKSTDPDDKEPWKDKGVGQLFIKCDEGASKGSKESKPRILVRNDVGRVMLNALLYSGIKTNLQKNAVVAIFHTSDGGGGGGGESGNAKPIARTYLIKTKNEEERNRLADAIRDHAPV